MWPPKVGPRGGAIRGGEARERSPGSGPGGGRGGEAGEAGLAIHKEAQHARCFRNGTRVNSIGQVGVCNVRGAPPLQEAAAASHWAGWTLSSDQVGREGYELATRVIAAVRLASRKTAILRVIAKVIARRIRGGPTYGGAHTLQRGRSRNAAHPNAPNVAGLGRKHGRHGCRGQTAAQHTAGPASDTIGPRRGRRHGGRVSVKGAGHMAAARGRAGSNAIGLGVGNQVVQRGVAEVAEGRGR